jgi:hypothetical protein
MPPGRLHWPTPGCSRLRPSVHRHKNVKVAERLLDHGSGLQTRFHAMSLLRTCFMSTKDLSGYASALFQLLTIVGPALWRYDVSSGDNGTTTIDDTPSTAIHSRVVFAAAFWDGW